MKLLLFIHLYLPYGSNMLSLFVPYMLLARYTVVYGTRVLYD